MNSLRSTMTRLYRDQRGQALALVAGGMVALVGMAGFVIDVGYALSVRQALQASTDAAASAGAMEIGTANDPVAKARAYSSVAGNANARATMPGVTFSANVKCTNFMAQQMTGANCTSGTTPANTIVVTQTAPVSTFFSRVFGYNTLNVTTTATVAMKGGGMPPLDVMIVLDATASMGNNCSASIPGVTNPDKMDCAKAGIKALLTAFWPCAPSTGNCGTITNGNVNNPIDRVGLAVFPSPKTTSVNKDFDCAGNMGSSDNLSYTSTSPAPTYIIRALSSDYKTSAFGALNGGATGNNLVKAVSWTDGVGCGNSNNYGIENPGGFGSYFAGAINAAQANLAANTRTGVRKVIIFVSDGDANRPSGSPSGTYPCRQAITAAQAATAAGTWVYSVAYGASTSTTGSCTDDTPRISAFQTMQQIASDSTRFFSQPAAGDLVATFQKIGQSLLNTRVLDNGTT